MKKSFLCLVYYFISHKKSFTAKNVITAGEPRLQVITNKTYFTVSVKYEARITYPRNKEFLNTGL